MGWELRRNTYYYYRKIRVDGKVLSVYCGNSKFYQDLSILLGELRSLKIKDKIWQEKFKGSLLEFNLLAASLNKPSKYTQEINARIDLLTIICYPNSRRAKKLLPDIHIKKPTTKTQIQANNTDRNIA